MSRQQTLPFTEDTSTCLQADSPASLLALQAREKARTITVTSGQRCCEQFEKFGHVGLWAKTFSALLIGRTEWYSSRCNLIWRMKGTKFNRFLFQLAPSMLRTEEIGSGLSPTVGMLKTPSAMDSNESLAVAKKNPTSGDSGCLAQEIANGWAERRGLIPTVVTQGLKYCNKKGQSVFVNPQFLPTPLSTEVAHPQRIADLKAKGGQTMGSRKNGESRPNGIQDYSMWHNLLPTVKAQDCRHALHDRGKINLGEEISETFGDGTSQNSQLNPQFVAEMMGFPTDWTLLPFLRGAENQSKPTATP